MENGLLYTISPVHEKPFEILSPSRIEFFGLNYRQFQATQKYTESVRQAT